MYLRLLPSDKEKFVVSSEREMLREEEETRLGERTPFDSSRQATYEDGMPPESESDYEDS
jgi:hypothetical protein